MTCSFASCRSSGFPLALTTSSDGARQIFGEMAAAGVDPDRWTDAALSLAGDAPALRSLRERAVRRWVQSGEDGFAAVRRLLDLLCDRQRAHEGLFVAVLRAAAFSTGEHEEWIRQMISKALRCLCARNVDVERPRVHGPMRWGRANQTRIVWSSAVMPENVGMISVRSVCNGMPCVPLFLTIINTIIRRGWDRADGAHLRASC